MAGSSERSTAAVTAPASGSSRRAAHAIPAPIGARSRWTRQNDSWNDWLPAVRASMRTAGTVQYRGTHDEEPLAQESGPPQPDPAPDQGPVCRQPQPAHPGAKAVRVRERLSLLRPQDRQPVDPEDPVRPGDVRVLGPEAVPLPEQAQGRRAARHQGSRVPRALPVADDRLPAVRQLGALLRAAEASPVPCLLRLQGPPGRPGILVLLDPLLSPRQEP